MVSVREPLPIFFPLRPGKAARGGPRHLDTGRALWETAGPILDENAKTSYATGLGRGG